MLRFASRPDLGQQLAPPMVFSLWLGLGPVVLAKFAIGRRTNFQGFAQRQKRRMPLRQPIIGQPLVAAIVAKVIEKSRLHSRCFGVGMNIAQGIQRSSMVGIGKGGAVVALFPKVPGPVQHAVKAHRRVPIQPVHNLGQFLGLLRLQQVMHMVAHNAEGIELKTIFGFALGYGIQQHFATGQPRQPKFSIIAADCDVIAASRRELTRLSSHSFSRNTNLLLLSAAQTLRETLIQYAVDTQDYTGSDRFIELLRPRRLELGSP